MRTTPTQVPGGPWTGVAAGDDQTCVLDQTHLLWCAGRTGYGQLATTGSHTTPTRVAGTWSDFATGYRDTCAIDAVTSYLSCWGANDAGTVGDGTILDRELPAALGTQTWSGITVGDDACGLDSTNQLYCWGANYFGEAGDPSRNDFSTAKPVLAGVAMSNVSTSLHTCAIGSQSLYCWGRNQQAECAAPDSLSVPVGSPLVGTWLAVATGSSFTCAIELSGMAIECWGSDSAGELGDNDNTERSSPVVAQVPSLPFDRITSGENHTCAHTTANAVYCWGWNLDGQLGDQQTDDHHVPAILPGTWADISAGARFTCGIKQDMTLWCWGANEFGQLGVGTFGEHHEPQQVGSDSDWKQVRAGAHHACARKTDSSLWCWDLAYDGELGDGLAWRFDLQVVP
jgi:alpha-tubulin suppressor-like RCC1 family protein